jgi:hypothetical protein
MPTQPAKGYWFSIEARRERPANRRQGAWRYFFVAIAVSYALVAIVGFGPELFRGPDLAHPLIAYIHGALMSAWLLLLIVQTSLAASGAVRWHRTFGLASIWLAAVMWASLGVVSVAQLSKFPYYDTLLVQLDTIVLFALFFVWGVLVRRDVSSHKRLLTLAALVLLPAAVDRMDWLPDFGFPNEYWPYAMRLDALIVPLFVFDFGTIKRIHPITLIGTGAILAGQMAIWVIMAIPAWHNFAHPVSSADRRISSLGHRVVGQAWNIGSDVYPESVTLAGHSILPSVHLRVEQPPPNKRLERIRR